MKLELSFVMLMVHIKTFAFQMSLGLFPSSLSGWGIDTTIMVLIFLMIIMIAIVGFISFLNSKEDKGSTSVRQKCPLHDKPSQNAKNQNQTAEILKLQDQLKTKERNIENLNKELDNRDTVINQLNIEIKALNELLNINNNKSIGSALVKSDSVKVLEPSAPSTHKQDFTKINLTVLEGPLVEAGPEHAVYYKAWREGSRLLFEFVNNDRTKKAINNRTSIIEPFCEKVETSKSPDDSERIKTCEPGVLNEDYSIRVKAKIEYV